MKTLNFNNPNSPNRRTCNICGIHIDGFETLCTACKRIPVGDSLSDKLYSKIKDLKQQRDDLRARLEKTTKYLEIRTKKQSNFSVPRLVDNIIEDNRAAITKANLDKE